MGMSSVQTLKRGATTELDFYKIIQEWGEQ